MMKSNSQYVTIPLKAIYHTCAITCFLLCWFTGINTITYFLLSYVFLLSCRQLVFLYNRVQSVKRIHEITLKSLD